jgi:putative addiction module CopG family antidote
MNVLMKPELEQFISDKVKSGQYADASDMVNEALEVLRKQEQFTPEHEAYLRQEVRKGLDQLETGQRANFDAEKIISEERKRLERQKNERT